ncbi:MAG: 4-oxalocrotonate tautomerase family protein [Thermoplasmata archaeon]
MPVVIVKLIGKLTKEQKKKIATDITASLNNHAGKPPEATHVIFEEHEAESWAHAGILFSEMKK